MDAQETDEPLTEAAREALILDHVPLLHHIVGRLALELPPRIERDDLLGWGMLGLITAADGWDRSRGLKFSTYAYSRIRGAVLDELRRMDFLPRGRRDRVRELERAFAALQQRNGGKPAPEELAEELGITLDEVDEILESARSAAQVSIDDGPGEELGALLDDPRSEDPTGSAERAEAAEALAAAIAGLSDTEQTVITLYYAEGLLLKEIGEVIGVTESRVSQLHTRALYRLNRELAGSLDPR